MSWSIHVWVLSGLHALVFVLGVPGNALIIRVFAKKRRKTSTHVFILGLAIADLYVCITTAAMIAYWFFEYNIESPWMCQGGYYSIVLGVYYSLFVTTVIAVERYYAVCKPHDKIVTPFRARVAMILSVVAAAVVSAPSILFSDVIEGTVVDENHENTTVHMCWPAPDDIPEWIGATAMYSIYVISLVLVAGLYGKVYTTIRDKVLGGGMSVRASMSASMRSGGSPARSITPMSKIDEGEVEETVINKIDNRNGSPAPSAQSNGSANHCQDKTSYAPSPEKSNGSLGGIIPEIDKNLEGSIDNSNRGHVGSTEILIQDSKEHEMTKSQEVYDNNVDLEDENDGNTNKSDENDDTNDVKEDKTASREISENGHITQNGNGKHLETPVRDDVESKNYLSVSQATTPNSSPSASPKKGPVIIDTTPAVLPNRHFEPIKYDDDDEEDEKGKGGLSRGGKRQSSLMSFRGFLSRPLGSLSSHASGSFNSQASTRSMASQKMQTKTTNMLLLVTIVTYVTWIPTLVSSVILVDTPDTRDKKYSEAVITILLVMKMLFIANHAANPFIYTIVNDRFRKDCVKELQQIFGCTDKRRF